VLLHIGLVTSLSFGGSFRLHAAEATTKEGHAGIDQGTFTLFNCIVARNAGDVRWLDRSITRAEKSRSSVDQKIANNAFQILVAGCPVDGADVVKAAGLARGALPYHPNALNLPSPMDAVAECLLEKSPEKSRDFIKQTDEIGWGAPGGYKSLGSELPKCQAELQKAGGTLLVNKLYSAINWRMRAELDLRNSSR
jgi:hypothetical protein